MCASVELDSPTLVSYADIIYQFGALEALLCSSASVALAVDYVLGPKLVETGFPTLFEALTPPQET